MNELPLDIQNRTRLLAEILSDSSSWVYWLTEKPQSLASILGVCDEGTRVIRDDMGPQIVAIYQAHHSHTRGDKKMADDQPPVKVELPGESYAKLADTLLKLLTLGLKQKKKVDKLKGLVTAWEQTGDAKDRLIRILLHEKLTPGKKKIAQEIYGKLEELQDKLKELHKKIDADASDDDIELLRGDLIRRIGELDRMFTDLRNTP